jgi:hypothetical protein
VEEHLGDARDDAAVGVELEDPAAWRGRRRARCARRAFTTTYRSLADELWV